MRNGRIIFAIVAVLFFVFGVTSCVIDDSAHVHKYGSWEITVAPTLEEVGTAAKVCEAGDKTVEIEIPALSNEIAWNHQVVSATCSVKGKDVYTSVYGTIEFEYETVEHEYSAWVIDEEPTKTSTGVASRTCKYGETDTVELPALTDTSVWTAQKDVEADYNHEGEGVFTSEYGTVRTHADKLVAPYDNQTYGNFGFDADDSGTTHYGVVSKETAWSAATISIDGEGYGEGTAFPFRGAYNIEMVDAATGEIKITVFTLSSDADGAAFYDESNTTVYRAFVDFESGIIVRAFNSSFVDVLVLTPFETDTTESDATASSWSDSMAIEYNVNDTTYYIFINNETVYFGVSFKDALGNAVAAADCYNAPYVYVYDKDGKLIKGFAFNGEKEVETDGLEGTYTSDNGDVFVSGFGTITIGEEKGTYTIATDASYTLDVYADGSYYEVTLEDSAATVNKPMVTITFDADAYATVEAMVVNKNIAVSLPEPTSETQTFKGWTLELTEESVAIADDYIPTADVTLYAIWKAKVIINIVSENQEDTIVLYLGEGDTIGNYLPEYKYNLTDYRVFKGWYLDETYETELPEEAEVTESDSNITIYAKWEDLPAYFGDYYGTEVWSATAGNSAKVELHIDENGKMTGKWNNYVVVSYDKESQEIKFKPSATSSTVYTLWFDEASGIMVTQYSSYNETGTDFYIFSSASTSSDYKCVAQYGFMAPKQPGSSATGYYARIVKINTKDGVKEIFVYNNHIYSDVVFKDAEGNILNVTTASASKTLVVYEGDEIVLAIASKGDSFAKNSNTVVLDAYFGTYTDGEETIVLDGSGNIEYGDKTGTYALATSDNYQFDVYLEDNTEYYQLTLIGDSFSIVKPMATITFVTGEGHAEVAAIEVNINVPVVLKDALDSGYVFNGWFLDPDFVTAVPTTFVVTADTTVYAKYSLPAILTIVYNNNEADEEIVYSIGDAATIDTPLYSKHAFVGWYTTADFEEGTEWTSGSVMNEDVTIYAKWEDAPVYNNTYMVTQVSGSTTTGGNSSIYSRNSSGAIIYIDPYGKSSGSAYPFNNSNIYVDSYDAETNSIKIYVGSSYFYGYIDPETGIIITSDSTNTTTISSVYLWSPFDTKSLASTITSSYWDAGKVRIIEYPYTDGDESNTMRIYIADNTVYFNVTFTDASGEAVAATNAYKTSNSLLIKDAEGNLIAKYGYDSVDTTMKLLDGLEGEYYSDSDKLTLDGIDTVVMNGVSGKYYVAKGADYTLDVYINGEYYEVTLDTEAATYTANKPYVTITFITDGKAEVASITVNKNIEITLPTPENDNYVFRAWYTEEALTNAVSNNYVPTSTTTLYAKWDSKVTLTVVYGNGLDNVVYTYGAGDTVNPAEPAFTNNKAFSYWSTDEAGENTYKLGVINEDMTIYAQWIDAVAMYGSYSGIETWGSSASGGSCYGGTSNKTLNITVTGAATGEKSGTIEIGDDGYGKLGAYRAYYNDEYGILVLGYYSGSTFGTDFYVFVKNTSYTTTNSDASQWISGKYRLLTLTSTSSSTGEKSTITIFVANEVVYCNVTAKCGDTAVASKDAYKQDSLTVYNAEGEAIMSFTKGTSGLALDE